MKQITSLTDNAFQQLSIILDDGSIVSMSIHYVDNQQGWFYSLSYNNFLVNNSRLVNSPNILREFRNIIPFGISCTIADGYEPIFQNDFISGRCTIYILNASDILVVEELITRTLPQFSGYPLN